MRPPRQDVRDAFLSPVTQIIRRVEIYEQDGATPWLPDLWDDILVDGTVNIDATREERRGFDATLVNIDGLLSPKPGGLYYDKVFKIFYGIVLGQQPRQPRVAIVEEENSPGQALAFKTLLSAAGFPQVRFVPLVSTYAEVKDYDIVVSISADYPRKLSLLNEAIYNGKSVFTLAPRCTAGQMPTLIASADAALTTTSEDSEVTKASLAHPLVRGWQGWKINSPFTYRKINSVTSLAKTVATIADVNNTAKASILAVEVPGGARWLHMQQSMFDAAVFPEQVDADSCGAFLFAAVAWLNPFVPLDEWEMQIFEGLADSIEDEEVDSEQIRLVGRDYTKRCQAAKLPAATMWPAGTLIEDLVRTLAINSGITKINLPSTGRGLGKDTTWDPDTSRWEIMKEIATANNYELYFTPDGYLTMRPFNDPLLTPPTFTLSAGDHGYANMVSRGVTTNDTQIFNHVVVIGESASNDAPAVWAEAKNTSVGPTSIAELGVRTMKVSSALVTTTAQAQELANSYLKVAALQEFKLTFSSITIPWIDVGEIMELDSGDTWGPTRYLISSLEIPLNLEPMSGDAKRVTQVA